MPTHQQLIDDEKQPIRPAQLIHDVEQRLIPPMQMQNDEVIQINTKFICILGVLLIVCGILSVILTLVDRVGFITYTFPNSSIDTISHNWDCTNFEISGVLMGVLTILFGWLILKYDEIPNHQQSIKIFIALFLLLMAVASFLLPMTFFIMDARFNSANDPDSSKDFAITNEGFELGHHTLCGTYMSRHHIIGLFGTLLWALPAGIVMWALFLYATVTIVLYKILLRPLYKMCFYVCVCKSACPECVLQYEDKENIC